MSNKLIIAKFKKIKHNLKIKKINNKNRKLK